MFGTNLLSYFCFSIYKLQKGAQNPQNKKSNTSPPKNKSTNVNTIPTFPKMSDTVNGLTTKINKDSELVKNPAPNMQIQSQMNVKIVETVPEIKAGDSPLPNANTDDTLTKKETKKNKKNKKRHRDEKVCLVRLLETAFACRLSNLCFFFKYLFISPSRKLYIYIFKIYSFSSVKKRNTLLL